jgi:hypothetical protein
MRSGGYRKNTFRRLAGRDQKRPRTTAGGQRKGYGGGIEKQVRVCGILNNTIIGVRSRCQATGIGVNSGILGGGVAGVMGLAIDLLQSLKPIAAENFTNSHHEP